MEDLILAEVLLPLRIIYLGSVLFIVLVGQCPMVLQQRGGEETLRQDERDARALTIEGESRVLRARNTLEKREKSSYRGF